VPRDFYLYLASRFASATALTLMRSAISWHIYSVSHSAFHLGLVGIVQFIPALLLTLVGGAVADSFDRRRIINGAQVVLLLAGAILFAVTQRGSVTLFALYASVLLIASAGAFESPARIALLPGLVPRERFPRAVTISSTNQALAFASGPAIGGMVIARYGIGVTYGLFLLLIAVAFALILMLQPTPRPDGVRRSVSLSMIQEGLRFVWTRPVVLG
jgi:MFS family permease